VKAAQVKGKQYRATSGAGYLTWSPFQAISESTVAVSSTCESQIHVAEWQDDGPRGSGKISEIGDYSFRIYDSPGLSSTMADCFPFALLAKFIVRVTVVIRDLRIIMGATNPLQWPAVVEFPYRTYFEVLKDPYPKGFREQTWVPRLVGQRDLTPFDEINSKFQSDKIKNATPTSPTQGTTSKTTSRPLRSSGS
jgi:hypothetical protein